MVVEERVIQVHVRQLRNNRWHDINVNIGIHRTILELKEKIAEQEGIPVEQQKLFLSQKNLQNNATTQQSEIESKGPLTLVISQPAHQLTNVGVIAKRSDSTINVGGVSQSSAPAQSTSAAENNKRGL